MFKGVVMVGLLGLCACSGRVEQSLDDSGLAGAGALDGGTAAEAVASAQRVVGERVALARRVVGEPVGALASMPRIAAIRRR